MQTTLIKPEDINIWHSRCFMSSMWQNLETEVSAYYLVKMAQENGSWRDFTKKEIDKVANEDFWFNKLRRYPFDNGTQPGDSITHNEKTGKYSFTHNFIVECYRLSPNTNKKGGKE